MNQKYWKKYLRGLTLTNILNRTKMIMIGESHKERKFGNERQC